MVQERLCSSLPVKRSHQAFGRDSVCSQQCSYITGTISSLQRQLEIQESHLRRTKSEKETLQKRLRERENQLRAMSAKVLPPEHGGLAAGRAGQRGTGALGNSINPPHRQEGHP